MTNTILRNLLVLALFASLFSLSGTSLAATVNVDFNGDSGPLQAGYEDFGFAGGDNDAYNDTDTFVGVIDGGDLTVNVIGNRRKFRNAVTGTFAAQSNFLRDWYGSNGVEDTIVNLTMPAGMYSITLFHHDVFDPGGTTDVADLTLTDANGVQNFTGIDQSGDSSPTTIETFTTNIVSDGSTPISFQYETSAQFAINGFELTSIQAGVPEPSTLVMLLGLLSLGLRRRMR